MRQVYSWSQMALQSLGLCLAKPTGTCLAQKKLVVQDRWATIYAQFNFLHKLSNLLTVGFSQCLTQQGFIPSKSGSAASPKSLCLILAHILVTTIGHLDSYLT